MFQVTQTTLKNGNASFTWNKRLLTWVLRQVGGTCKLGALCFYSSSVLVDGFVLRNPPERKARKRQR
jgi:hypothetical protein